ncbi:MAG: DUF551 domain-containing protein [Clostridiales bacterium]|nr:DUF551 domain-containing protein [Clostridiales bacterium]
MVKCIDSDALLDSMGKAARKLDTEGITDVDDMLDAMEEAMRECVHGMPAADVEPVRRWIPVEDKSPEDGQVVNVITKSKEGYDGLDIVIYRQTGENGAFCTAVENNDLEIYGMHVTHWIPVPDFPQKMDGGSEWKS